MHDASVEVVESTSLENEDVSLGRAFADDHARLERARDAFRRLRGRDFARATIALRAFARDLRRHVRCEESVLAAAFDGPADSRRGPMAVMHSEHRRILEALARLEAKVESGDGDCDEEEAMLLELLETHEFKEDKVLYPMLDRMLDAERRRRVLAELAHVAEEGNPKCCA